MIIYSWTIVIYHGNLPLLYQQMAVIQTWNHVFSVFLLVKSNVMNHDPCQDPGEIFAIRLMRH